MENRKRIETILREASGDAEGSLRVDEDGPHWSGNRELALSYAHDEDTVFLVWSTTEKSIGVDLEPEDRIPKHPVLDLARRFFHPDEADRLARLLPEERLKPFHQLWLEKEALAKLTRSGLKKTLPLDLETRTEVEFVIPALLPDGKDARIAFFRLLRPHSPIRP
jgi:hypothetical protein